MKALDPSKARMRASKLARFPPDAATACRNSSPVIVPVAASKAAMTVS
jgi:hypothetical protein